LRMHVYDSFVLCGVVVITLVVALSTLAR
jgi:hypothetical protein